MIYSINSNLSDKTECLSPVNFINIINEFNKTLLNKSKTRLTFNREFFIFHF